MKASYENVPAGGMQTADDPQGSCANAPITRRTKFCRHQTLQLFPLGFR
jgi:hypothetical protein